MNKINSVNYDYESLILKLRLSCISVFDKNESNTETTLSKASVDALDKSYKLQYEFIAKNKTDLGFDIKDPRSVLAIRERLEDAWQTKIDFCLEKMQNPNLSANDLRSLAHKLEVLSHLKYSKLNTFDNNIESIIKNIIERSEL